MADESKTSSTYALSAPAAGAPAAGAPAAGAPAAGAPAAGAPAAGAPPVAEPVPPVPDPFDDLAKLKEKLQEDQSKNAALSKELDLLKSQISELEKSLDEIKQKKTAYEKGRQTLEQQETELDKYYTTKKTMLEATVTNKDAVVKTKHDGDQEVADLAAKVDALKQQIVNNAKAYAEDATDTQVKKQKYDLEVNLFARNEAWVKDLAGLRTAIEKEPTKNVSRGFFFILEMADVFKKLDLPDPDAYLKRLKDAASNLNSAANKEREAKQGLDKSTADLQQAQKELDDTKAKRRDKILGLIPENAVGAAP